MDGEESDKKRFQKSCQILTLNLECRRRNWCSLEKLNPCSTRYYLKRRRKHQGMSQRINNFWKVFFKIFQKRKALSNDWVVRKKNRFQWLIWCKGQCVGINVAWNSQDVATLICKVQCKKYQWKYNAIPSINLLPKKSLNRGGTTKRNELGQSFFYVWNQR